MEHKQASSRKSIGNHFIFTPTQILQCERGTPVTVKCIRDKCGSRRRSGSNGKAKYLSRLEVGASRIDRRVQLIDD